MPRNVHYMNIHVKPKCAPSDIGATFLQAHNALMAQRFGKTFIREWRKHRGKVLVQVAEHLHMTHGQLSKIERGQQPYNQELLERLAEMFMCEPVDLIIRNPLEPDNIWSIWSKAKPGERAQIIAVAEALVKRTGTDG